jgi:ribosomal peptide maturation radical SAM protein 1
VEIVMQIQKDNATRPRRHLSVTGPSGRERLTLAEERAPRRLRTALVNMPFVSTLRPSVQLGLLKAIGERRGYPIDTFHLNLDFCAQLGSRAYEALCHHRGRMFGDWLFSLAAFGERAPDPEDALAGRFASEAQAMQRAAGLGEDGLQKLRREEVPRFLAQVLASVPWREFDVVGFTSTFEQTVAAAALAREIRAIHPDVRIIFGGANLDGDMGKEVVRTFPVIDYGVSGEADTSFPALLGAIARDREPSDVPGVIWRKDAGLIANPPSAPLTTMDELPVPEYDEYFERARALALLPPGGVRDVMIPFESSRGCWWGAKNHCTFCGLNGSTMKFRAKSPERVATELATLSRRHKSFRFEAVDNIMDHRYMKSLLPKLASADTTYSLFYEIKSNVGREELRLMQQAGIERVQPGIESLSTAILRLMRKGVRASQNVNMMRWARYYGIAVSWNLIYGFPGEQVVDYERQARLLPLLVHLDPPSGCGPVWLERFSPLYRERDKFPATRVAPEASYSYVYPPEVNLNELAYFFDYELEGTLPRQHLDSMVRATEAWKDLWKAGKRTPRMTFFRSEDFLQIDDQRAPDNTLTHSFEGPLALLYQAASDAPKSVAQLITALGLTQSAENVTRALEEFCRRGLMMEDSGLYLSLALPAGVQR